MNAEPGADELRMRAILRAHDVGPDAPPPDTEDWWSPQAPPPSEDETEDEEPEEDDDRTPVFAPQPGYYPRPHTPAIIHRVRDRAPAALSPRTRAGLYNASAAGTGWALGLYDQFAWALRDCGQESIGGAIVLGAGGCLLIAHVWDRRTRHWWPGIAWCARIPLATALLALALWAPAST